jgi:hypothetical protein
MTMALDIARCLYPILIASRLPDFRGMSAFSKSEPSNVLNLKWYEPLLLSIGGLE